ncbi:MAG: acyl carrier protein [Bryobacteraceae bacterium]
MATPAGGITADQVRAEVKKLIADITEREPEEVGDKAMFAEELGIDSLTGMEVMLAIDKKFKTDLPEEEFAKVKNVDDIVDLVQRFLPKTA